MDTNKRRQLSLEEIADAQRLKEIYNQRKLDLSKEGRRLTQDDLAHRCGWSGQSAVSQYINARVALNLEAVIKFARELDVRVSDISPRLAKIKGPTERSDELNYLGDLCVWDSSAPLESGEVELPLFREVELAAGDGRTQVIENGGAKLRFSKSTLREAGVDETQAGAAYVSGNSMEPALMDGSVVGINKLDVQIRDGKTYALDHEGMLRVKQVFRLPGGGIRLHSINEAEFPDEEFGPGWPEYIRVVGRIFWSSTIW